ncbi:MAG: UMP kinase [Candidatus Kuenenbacteria bacterium]
METIIISLGGSLVVPNEIDFDFLKKFKDLILKYLKKEKRFFIISGGGKTARNYQNAALKITKITKEDLDWIGIHSTRINAHLLRTIFKNWAYPKIITNPQKIKKNIKEKIIIAAGWKPGWSTDFVAVKLAQAYKIKTILNLSNVSFVFDKDPNKYKNAKPLKKIDWFDFRKIVGNKWSPGANLPFDPIASKLAEKLKLNVIILKGNDFQNLNNFLNKKNFKGTTIQD